MTSQRNDVLEQWVSRIEYCSVGYHSLDAIPNDLGLKQICGIKDVASLDSNNCINNGWILSNTNQQEQLAVSCKTPVFIDKIHIHENLNPGSIVKLEVLESQTNKWWVMWKVKSRTIDTSLKANVFQPNLRQYRFQSNTIRITLDPTYTDRIGIGSIKIIGKTIFDRNLSYIKLSDAMIKLYEHALRNVNCDIEFIIDGTIVNAHRNILCYRSSYFRALLLGDFSEKNPQVPIQLTDIDYETFLEVLFILYSGTYHGNISCELAIKCMIYCDKINFMTGKCAATENICFHLRKNQDLLLSIYCFVKEASPKFDDLLNFIYDLCAECMKSICITDEFIELDKHLMVDLITESTKRRK